jgi:hypothetical protein
LTQATRRYAISPRVSLHGWRPGVLTHGAQTPEANYEECQVRRDSLNSPSRRRCGRN